MIKYITNHFEEEQQYKPVGVGNFWSRIYIKYDRNGDRNKTLSVEEYLKLCYT